MDPVERFAALAERRLAARPPWVPDGRREADAPVRGDHELNAGKFAFLIPGAIKPAAVLVPVIRRSEGPTILFTRRGTALRSHSGQISFPGGKMDPDDASPLATALREAREEIGLDPSFVRPVGYGEAYLSATGYIVTPAVALVDEGFTLSLNPFEVSEVFEVPLAFLFDPANHELHARLRHGVLRQYYAIPFGDRYIWGVTAGILRNLYERLYQP